MTSRIWLPFWKIYVRTDRKAFWLCTVDRVHRLLCSVRPCWRPKLWTNTRRLQTNRSLWTECSQRRRCQLWATSVETRHAFRWYSWWEESRRLTLDCPTSPWCSSSSSPSHAGFSALPAHLKRRAKHYHWPFITVETKNVNCVTVKHILVECANLRDIHEKYFTVSSLADLFDRVDNHSVIDFIKETHFYHQL